MGRTHYRRPQMTDRLADHIEKSPMGALLADMRGRVFPDHWSFLFGQIAFHSFVIVLLSGTFLLFFYEQSSSQVAYDGSYMPLRGVEMSRALASTLDISFDVRGGLLVRQIHHWGASLMVVALMMHILRLFFTAAFRKPRQLAWFVTFIILLVTMASGFTGASLPDDLLSGTSMMVLDGVLKSIPFIGVELSAFVFGGPYPGDVIALFYPLHALVLPALLIVLFLLLTVLAVVHKPAQFAGPGRSNGNVVGRPLSTFALKSAGLFFIVAGLLSTAAATVTVNPVWIYGPADPGLASAGAGALWYLGFLDGALRLVPPGWEFVWLDRTWTLAVLIPVAAASLFLVVAAAYPLVDRWISGDNGRHHLLERPRNNPARTGIGVAGIAFYGVLWASAGADTLALHFSLALEDVLHVCQALLFIGPIMGFAIARRICLGLQRKDREIALHGTETGRIVRLHSGEYMEVHKPVDEYRRWKLSNYEEHKPLSVRPDSSGRLRNRDRVRVAVSKFFFEDRVAPVTPDELDEGVAYRRLETAPEPVDMEAARKEIMGRG